MTPTPNTATPSHGAQSPSVLDGPTNTDAGVTPTAWMPATMPNAISASCTTAATSRLDPEIDWPADSSSTAVVIATPGRNTTSAATIAARPGSVRSCLMASASRADTEKAAMTGINICSCGCRCPTWRRRPTIAPSTAAAAASRRPGCRIRHSPSVNTA